MNSSTGLPALTMSMTRRGFLSRPTISCERMRAEDLGALGFVVEEIVHLGDGAVEGHDGEAVVVHVQNQILAHDGQPDQCDVSFWFHLSYQLKLENRRYNSPPGAPAVFYEKPTQNCVLRFQTANNSQPWMKRGRMFLPGTAAVCVGKGEASIGFPNIR